ncbi:MAG TPA: ShlB/FhaC/HecB family hemolysin secretion/activation protein [Noviherbaspirillum sp.]|jgi:hemolysin activation/secretion protein|uniref:ShlB/FhaC/HecB family hemolysin secretion/activation protein n=1 Tax=Noviherbaspirillum sp. TaxID=1926288 RepID=UPI002F94A74A
MPLHHPRSYSPRSARRLQFLFCLSVALAPAAFAQTAADTREAARQAEILQRQNQERVQRELEAITEPRRVPSGIDTDSLVPRIDASGIGRKCRDIREIVITGSPNLSERVREDISRRFTGQCLGVGEIEQILGEITKDYIGRGFITTRAYLPQQDLSSGRLEITVLEGVIEEIMLEDGGKDSIRIGTVFPDAGELFNLRDFEQGIDQVNKLSSNNAQLDIQPGDRPGASKVVIRNAPRTPLHASLSVDNQGSEGTGKTQLGASVIGDSLLSLNELLLFSHRQSHPDTTRRTFSASDSASFVLPLRYSTFSVSASRSRYVSTLHMPSGLDLRATGNSANDTWRLDRVMYRDQATRLTMSGTLNIKNSKNYLAGEYLAVSSRKLSVLDLDASFSTGVAGGVLEIAPGISRGLDFAGALEDPGYLPGYAPRAQFNKYKLALSYFRPFQVGGTNFSISTSFTGQRSEHTLYGSEQLLIGGIYSVRGFVKNALSGDNGFFIRNDLAAQPVVNLAGTQLPLRVYAGLDYGKVSNRVADIPSGELIGCAIGISTAWKGLSVDISNARPISMPSFFHREGSQTWVRLNYSI